MVTKWKPFMTPDKYRKYEIDLIKNHKKIIASGLGFTLINKNKLNTVKKEGFVDYPITIYDSFDKFITHNDNIEIILFCQIIILNESDGDISNPHKLIIYNKKSIVIVGYLNEYNSGLVNHKWNPINSIKNAYNYFNNGPTMIGFHGTDANTAQLIKRDGFRPFAFLKDALVPANYFTPYIWYAYNWAHFKGQKGVVFVCLLSFDHPMPKRTFESIYKIKDEEERHVALLDKVADKKYDGIHLEDEIWVWNPTSVVIIGEIT